MSGGMDNNSPERRVLMKSVVRGRRRPFAILAVALVVAGCGATTVQTTTDSVSASGRLAFLETASRSSAVLVDVVRPSFQASEFETASATARHATGSVPGKDVRFTADASVVKDRNYRLMFAFDPLPGVTGNDVAEPERARSIPTAGGTAHACSRPSATGRPSVVRRYPAPLLKVRMTQPMPKW